MSTLLVTKPVREIKSVKVIAAALMLAVGISILAYGMSASEAAKRDYLSYWAAGQQLVNHQNAYDGEGVLRVEKSAGFSGDHPFYMRNPPTAFVMAYPLGFLPARLGVILWSILIIGCLMASIRMLWVLNGRPDNRLHLVGYLFPPALACLLAGQTGIFLLFGIVLFLRFHESRPYLAGASLLVLALKPHVFIPLGVALLLWIITTKSYRILAGALTAVGLSLVVAFLLDHSAWSHYFAMLRAENINEELVPTLSLLFRIAISQKHPWLQFVPALIACRWAFRYYLDNREDWDWRINVSLLLLVSVLVAPYAWFTDEVIVLPAIFVGLYRASNRAMVAYCCIAGIALIEVFANVRINSGAYIWTAPAWLLWYIVATKD